MRREWPRKQNDEMKRTSSRPLPTLATAFLVFGKPQDALEIFEQCMNKAVDGLKSRYVANQALCDLLLQKINTALEKIIESLEDEKDSLEIARYDMLLLSPDTVARLYSSEAYV
jgi:hypothetical protein